MRRVSQQRSGPSSAMSATSRGNSRSLWSTTLCLVGRRGYRPACCRHLPRRSTKNTCCHDFLQRRRHRHGQKFERRNIVTCEDNRPSVCLRLSPSPSDEFVRSAVARRSTPAVPIRRSPPASPPAVASWASGSTRTPGVLQREGDLDRLEARSHAAPPSCMSVAGAF